MFCKTNLVFFIVLCLTIIYVPACTSECDEYIIVFEERFRPIHKYTPKKQADINWDEVTYSDNSTANPKKKKCLIEFNCMGSELTCKNFIPKLNYQSHTIIPDEPKTPKQEKTHDSITQEPDIKYHVNLIYINENDKHATTCDYAQTVCADDENDENDSIRDGINPSVKTAEILQISIDRDETSPVQPIFTGYFPKTSNNSSKQNAIPTDSKTGTITLECNIFKDMNCKRNIENKYLKMINIYINTNITPNNTKTKYPNCTKDTSSSDKTLKIKCEDVQFAKHNQHILLTPPKKELIMKWNCEITKLNDSIPNKEKINKLNFQKCLNATNAGKNKYDDNLPDGPPVSEGKKIENSTEHIKVDLSDISPEKNIAILITEKESNCSHNSPLNIHQGKIVNLDLNNNSDILLRSSNIKLILSNCINSDVPIVKDTPPHPKVELIIILKNESLNTPNLKRFNGTQKEKNEKQIILLRCDHPNGGSSSKTIDNKTMLQCKSINLHLYNITGIEVNTNVTQASIKNKTEEQVIKSNTTEIHEEDNKNSDFGSNKTVEPKTTIKSIKNNTQLVENITVPKHISESKEYAKFQNINRRKDIPKGTGQDSLGLESVGTEKIMLITILAIVGASIFIIIALRMWPKKREYNIAPTREPPNDEETAF